ncbi:MAG: DUF5056 domain-containing protein [Tannerella sp.]|jgi:hypothetical protein|nr:DUF5056 domain-containing protein [Tannerella sp.]
METDEKDLKRMFSEQRREIADDGFSRGVKRRLPARPSCFPQMLTGGCAMIGMAAVFLLSDGGWIITGMSELFVSLGRLEWPSSGAMLSGAAWAAMLFCTLLTGYGVAAAE